MPYNLHEMKARTVFLLSVLFLLAMFNESLARGNGLNQTEIKKENRYGCAWIQINKQDNLIHIRAYFKSNKDEKAPFYYRLSTKKEGVSGQAFSFQSGEFRTGPGKQNPFFELTVSLSTGDKYFLSLDILDNQRHKLLSVTGKLSFPDVSP